METSFIPKKNYKKEKSKGQYNNLLLIFSVVIFVGTLIVSSGVFFYKSFLEKEIANKSVILEREKGNFDLSLIQKLARFDKRIEVTKQILEEHITLIPLFDFLEENTLKEVMFENFNFEIIKGKQYLRLDGKANSYAAVAVQSDVLAKNKDIIDPVFSELGINSDGDVIFAVDMELNNELALYKDNLTKE